MKQFPLLEQLRAEYRRRDDEIAEPLRTVIDELQRRINSLAASFRALESIIGSEIGKHAVEQIGYEIAGILRKHIAEAMPAAYRAGTGVFTLTLPVEILRFMDPKSLESEVLKRYAYETAPKLSARVYSGTQAAHDDFVTTLDIRIPELGYRCAMTDLPQQRRSA